MKKFATCLNCIDGRVQEPVINWIKNNYDVDYVDMITEPGIDGLLSKGKAGRVIEKARFSVENRDTSLLFIAGHHDCLANPVDDKKHINEIKIAVAKVKEFFADSNIVGLWISKEGLVEKIT